MEVHSQKGPKPQNVNNNFALGVVYSKAPWTFLHNHIKGPFYYIKYASLTLFLFYVSVPIFVKYNYWIMPKIVFSNVLSWPNINLSEPQDFGIDYGRNFKLHVEDGIEIGAWHLLPESTAAENELIGPDEFESTLDNGKFVILYLHGNTGTRGTPHRVQLYKLLQSLDYHVIAIDYRGFGDSTGSPTEDGVVQDSYFTYKWLKDKIGCSRIFLWGHSLGTGITTKLAKRLSDEGDAPNGVVLESPFNNIRDAAFYHPFARPYRSFPWFSWMLLEGLGTYEIHFNSEESIASVTPNILILHAEDDHVVPYHLGLKLYESARKTRNYRTGSVEFVPFEERLNYGHKFIYQDPALPEIIGNFIASCL